MCGFDSFFGLDHKPGTSPGCSFRCEAFQFPFQRRPLILGAPEQAPSPSRRSRTLLGKVGVNLTLGVAGTIGLKGAFWFIRLVLCC